MAQSILRQSVAGDDERSRTGRWRENPGGTATRFPVIGQHWPIAGTGAREADIDLREKEMGLEEFGEFLLRRRIAPKKNGIHGCPLRKMGLVRGIFHLKTTAKGDSGC